jgi:EAL domain-containing protein (putative c-di-GMP-specific phosphodiesterase class I)
MAHADAAMYHTKDNGRNGYTFFAPSMNISAHQQLKLLNDLRRAVERNELVLHYQPKFAAPDYRMAGVEALLRWQHPDMGLLPPGAFIAAAERSGLILSLGEWVLDEACRQLHAWDNAGHDVPTIAVNLSPLQFSSPSLVETVRDTLARHALDPTRLTLEITETTAMRDADASVGILDELTRMGVRISIDDFGTGYSSLLYLKRLPATELKIDRAFVRELESNADDAAIVASIVALGRTLNLKVVAEGVETPGQQQQLRQLGCDFYQGYLLGEPVAADRLMHTRQAAPAPCLAG